MALFFLDPRVEKFNVLRVPPLNLMCLGSAPPSLKLGAARNGLEVGCGWLGLDMLWLLAWLGGFLLLAVASFPRFLFAQKLCA